MGKYADLVFGIESTVKEIQRKIFSTFYTKYVGEFTIWFHAFSSNFKNYFLSKDDWINTNEKGKLNFKITMNIKNMECNNNLRVLLWVSSTKRVISISLPFLTKINRPISFLRSNRCICLFAEIHHKNVWAIHFPN